jgi:hypothetical protein
MPLEAVYRDSNSNSSSNSNSNNEARLKILIPGIWPRDW